jgi:hypothetical protein
VDFCNDPMLVPKATKETKGLAEVTGGHTVEFARMIIPLLA